jgi:hypothetical protein
MASKPKQEKGIDGTLFALDTAITFLDVAKDMCPIVPAQVAFGCVSTLLNVIRVRFPPSCEDVKFPAHNPPRIPWPTNKNTSNSG